MSIKNCLVSVPAMTAVTLRRRGNLQCLQGLSGNFPPRVTAAVHSGMEKTILANNSSFDVCVINSGISGGFNAKETMRRRRSFSDLGVALDRLRDEHGVTFIVAAGNCRQPAFRGWPPDDLGEDDRVCAPADSVRAIVVGSAAHRDHSSHGSKPDNPLLSPGAAPARCTCRSLNFLTLGVTAMRIHSGTGLSAT
jgi:hypothetical protein